jgi:hypothetical protein
MPTVAHVFQDVGCNKEVEDQRNHRLLAVTAGCAEMDRQYIAAISSARAGGEVLKRLSTKPAAEPDWDTTGVHHNRPDSERATIKGGKFHKRRTGECLKQFAK